MNRKRHRFDTVTFWVWFATPFVWLAIELLVFHFRGAPRPEGVSIAQTISMIARDRGWQLTSVVFFWTAMPFHWWLHLGIGWASRGGTITFWGIVAVLLAWNLVTLALGWTTAPLEEWPAWLRWVNWPVFYLLTAPPAAAFLFPQDGPVPWRTS